ncbi:HTTM domain-containing protein [Galbibacter sp. EGI 63066]|uniref:HTTM domain-containing protein n=1 Tax=Galbibacter sp. EGI 63066 TaxID=2993559 RepID=UPI002248F021|nr:HTTM domain-containing protein [Galbibacter sp. EGI 63066]MCX2681099.1 HTTM domain-containing protein [Galbibacter sp. EGI 63066]
MSSTHIKYFDKVTEAAPLAVFRVLFGVLMCVSIIRFMALGWVDKLYIQPEFFFSYYGFEWVKPIGVYTYLVFIFCGLSAFAVAVGYKYRMAIICFFLSFTYIELMDKTTYLNHYYFISITAFLMIFLPANVYFSVDAKRNKDKVFQKIPKWSIDAVMLLITIVYFYAGLAKLNSDWLFNAMPLKIWLPSKYDIPLLGDLFQQEWTHYAFSWIGVAYDLSIPFLLLFRRTRMFAFILVVVFHVFTRIMFPIGMFPYVMIFSALIFFSAAWHHKFLGMLSATLKINKAYFDNGKTFPTINTTFSGFKRIIILLFFAVQLLFPFRYLLYPGELFWTEEGYRFSWRVMLMEKAGHADFKVKDAVTKQSFHVDNSEFLTPFQEKQMSFQPDFILEYAHFLHDHYKKQGITNPEIYVNSYVTLNGRRSRPFIDSTVNLADEKESFAHKTWILPFEDEIKGL